MKNIEVIERVQALYSKGISSDDSRLSNRHIYNKLLTVRARLLVQQAKQKQKISNWNYQTLKCVELIDAPVHECPNVPDGCFVLRTKYPLPKIMTDLNRHLILSVTTLDGKRIFSETSWQAISFKKGNRFTKTSAEYYLKDGYLYLVDEKSLSIITITAIFGNPSEVDIFNATCLEEQDGCPSILEKEFPADMDMIDSMIRLTTDELILLFTQMAEDKANNASDDTSPIKLPRRSDKYIGE